MFDETELTIHQRIAKELERNVESRDWWLWIRFHLEEEGVDADVAGTGAEVEQWLRTMNVDLPAVHAYKLQLSSGTAISVEISAIPRGERFRGDPTLIANPLPVAAFFPGA